MKRTFFLLLTLGLLSCNPEELLPDEGQVDLKVIALTGATPEQQEYLEEVVMVAESTLNSIEFRKEFRKLKMTHTNGQSTAEIYGIMMTGNGSLNITMGNLGEGRGGSYNRELNRIRLNTVYFGHTHISHTAGTLVHEWLHSLGYDHEAMGNRQAVPYAVGELVTNLNR